MQFSKTDKKVLLELAFQSIENYILTGENVTDDPPVASMAIRENYGAFVSAYVGDDLRGCIGTFTENEPLYKNVRNMAVAAVSRDSRFKIVTRDELGSLDLEISVLLPRKLIKDISEIEIGRHGIFIIKGFNRGTFLPHVATEQSWNTEEYLRHCAKHKAGLDWDGWKSADIYIFETILITSKKSEL